MKKRKRAWQKLNVTVSGKEAGDFLAKYFSNDYFRTFNNNMWNYTYYCGDRTLFNLDEFKNTSLEFEVEIKFNLI